MFQITGETRYSELAWNVIESSFFKLAGRQLGGNFVREYSAELVLLYDWLYPALSQQQRMAFLSKLNEMFAVALTNLSNPTFPVRSADSDQTIGTYFGLAFLYAVTADYNSVARDYFARPFVGGFVATARDRNTMRNTIRDYVAMAAGGEWIEGTDYNLGTTRLLLLGAEGVRTATGRNYFPEVTEWSTDAAARPAHVITPDLKQSYQWGDVEHPGDFRGRLFSWQTTTGILASLGGPRRAHSQDLLMKLASQYGDVGYFSSEPWARMFLVFDPYAKTRAFSELPLEWYAEGQGLVTYRTGWDRDASMLGVHIPPEQPYVDHQVGYFGDFQLYRRGTWAISHPFSYAGPSVSGEIANTMLHGGFSAMSEVRRVVDLELDPAGSFAYIVGTTAGQKYPRGYYQPPPSYLHEWTRSIMYFPTSDRSSETIVVFDRSHSDDPELLPRFDRYSVTDRNTIVSRGHLKEWLIHLPVRPTATGQRFSWRLDNGDRATLSALLPRHALAAIVDERLIWPGVTMHDRQRRWQVRLSPPVQQQWDTFLNVIQIRGEQLSVSAELVRSIDDRIDGALIRRQGVSDMLVLFNALPGQRLPAHPSGFGHYVDDPSTTSRARLRTAGFSIEYVSRKSTDILIADLDPSIAWEINVDERPKHSLPVARSGLAKARVEGPGRHVLFVLPAS
jgi:hypothetical protein